MNVFNQGFKQEPNKKRFLIFGLLILSILVLIYSVFSSNREQKIANNSYTNRSIFMSEKLKDINYNSFNTPELAEKAVPTKEIEDLLIAECSYIDKSNNNLNLKDKNILAKKLTCIHYAGALMQESYWDIQDSPILMQVRSEVANLLESRGEGIRANLISKYKVESFTLNSLRNPNKLKGIDAQDYINANILCKLYLKDVNEPTYFTSDTSKQNATKIAATELCYLMQLLSSK